MTEHTLQGSGAYQRNVWLLEPAAGTDAGASCGIFLDGEFYVGRMDAPAVICGLQARGDMPAMPCLFVSHVDSAARHADLTCSPSYADFIAREALAWLRERVSTLAEGGHLIAGPSLGGLASAFITLTHPQVFAHCLSQSGSFWWKDEWLTRHLQVLPSSRSRFWISVGDRETHAGISHPPTGLRQEIAQIEGCAHFAAALSARGHEVRHSVHEGAHELQPWAHELPQALAWLLRRD